MFVMLVMHGRFGAITINSEYTLDKSEKTLTTFLILAFPSLTLSLTVMYAAHLHARAPFITI